MEKREEGAKKALGSVRVLEWASFVAGPFCARLLSDNGAEVIKVEEPGTGDDARRQGAFPQDIPHPEQSALFLYLNTNKKGITLNLKTEAGRQIFKKLIQEVDILIEDNPPHLVQELGLDYESLREVNPQLIMTSITPFGQTGPYRDYKCYYLNTFHASGFGYLTPSTPGDPSILEREPIMMGGFLAEYYSGVNAAIPTLASLLMGVGQHIDVSKQETQFISEMVGITGHCLTGETPNRATLSSGPWAGGSTWGGVLPCRDGYALIHGTRPNQIAALFDMMHNPEWSREEKFRPEVFHRHSSEAQPYVVAWAAGQYKGDIFHGGQRRGTTVAAVYTVEDAVNSEHLKAREFLVELDHPQAGRLSYPSAPYKFSETPANLEHPAPLLGEHNEEIYCDRLGYSRQKLVEMREMGII